MIVGNIPEKKKKGKRQREVYNRREWGVALVDQCASGIVKKGGIAGFYPPCWKKKGEKGWGRV